MATGPNHNNFAGKIKIVGQDTSYRANNYKFEVLETNEKNVKFRRNTEETRSFKVFFDSNLDGCINTYLGFFKSHFVNSTIHNNWNITAPEYLNFYGSEN